MESSPFGEKQTSPSAGIEGRPTETVAVMLGGRKHKVQYLAQMLLLEHASSCVVSDIGTHGHTVLLLYCYT
jgi:hypothetical protein